MPLALTFRILPVAAVLALASLSPAAHAADMKIGYFDVRQVLAEVEEAKAVKDKLQKDIAAKQKQIDAKRDELEKLQREIEQKGPVLSQSAKQTMAMDFQQKLVEANKLVGDLQVDLAQQEQKLLGELLGRLEPVVRELAEAEGYTYVVEKNEAGLFYAPSGHDLTAQLIRRYNQRFPGKGTAAKAPKKSKGK